MCEYMIWDALDAYYKRMRQLRRKLRKSIRHLSNEQIEKIAAFMDEMLKEVQDQ